MPKGSHTTAAYHHERAAKSGTTGHVSSGVQIRAGADLRSQLAMIERGKRSPYSQSVLGRTRLRITASPQAVGANADVDLWWSWRSGRYRRTLANLLDLDHLCSAQHAPRAKDGVNGTAARALHI
jgi:hypothetical protein